MNPHAAEIALNLAAALLAGSLIGFERSYHGRAAGFRTHALVALAAAAAMTISFEPEFIAQAFPAGTVRFDPTRIGQGVMTGVGFIGAGVIFKEGVSVQGLTTAACIWATAAVGMLFGLGMFLGGGLAAAGVLITLLAFRWIEVAMPGNVYALAIFRFQAGRAPTEAELCRMLGEHEVSLQDVSYKLANEGEIFEYRGSLMADSGTAFANLSMRLKDAPGLMEYDLARVSK